MVTEQRVKELCKDAERITITRNTVAMKVGEFSMAIDVDLSKEKLDVERKIKNLYMDLKAMNREQETQINQAHKEATREQQA